MNYHMISHRSASSSARSVLSMFSRRRAGKASSFSSTISNAFSTRSFVSTTLYSHQNTHRDYDNARGNQGANNDRLVIIGSGVAGCSTALIAAEKYRIPVTLLCAGAELVDCNSYWAQGGIIYRNYDPAAADSAESLVADVHRAGAGICNDEAVWKLAREGPERVRELLLDHRPGSERAFANVPFDRDENGELLCCLEASHSAARIIHYADQSGKAITEHITAAAANHPLVEVVSNVIVTDLITASPPFCLGQKDSKVCVGVQTMDSLTGKRGHQLSTRGVVVASGGLCGIYEHSTNPSGFNALGSSVGLALRAGARCADLEYVQFHPTSLCLPGEARFLLTEALRGEGAILRDANGRAFARDFHPDGELAPRDVVARGVFEWSQKSDNKSNGQQQSSQSHNVFLDITHRDPDYLRNRFPTIQRHLVARGMDLTCDMLPVVPAAHYTCGGIETDLNGRTCVGGLFAAGEAARTGVHGGNRLASTSLLEGLVFGAAVGEFVGGTEMGAELHGILADTVHTVSKDIGPSAHDRDLAERNNAAAIWLLGKLRRTMWDGVGVVRTPSGVAEAVNSISAIRQEANDLFKESPTTETAALRDAATAGEAVARAALANPVSTGAHFMAEDDPDSIENDEDLDVDEFEQREYMM